MKPLKRHKLGRELTAEESQFSAELMALLAAAGGADNFNDLKVALRSGQNFVSTLYDEMVKLPAEKAPVNNLDEGE